MSARAASTALHSAPQRQAAAPRTRPVAADASSAAALSPARLAQLELAARLAEEPVTEGRWQPRQGLGLAMFGSVVLWGALLMVGAALIS